MRTDTTLDDKIKADESWEAKNVGGREDPIDQSFSGNERNKLYYNVGRDGKRDFADLSTLSGMNSISDSRTFSITDFNRDGRPDVVLTNANAPSLNIYRNRIQTDHHFLAINFVGGMTGEKTEKRLSVRDGYGAIVTLNLSDDMTVKREFRCGEGFAGQNSDTMLIGIGAAETVQEIFVKWPSGITDSIKDVKADSLVTVIENGEGGKPSHKVADY